MVFKINISNKDGKTYKLELESEELIGRELGETIPGNVILGDLEGYELKISGLSDIAGFPSLEEVEGIGLARKLLTYGKGMHKRPRKEGKRKISTNTPKGLRLRKTVRGKGISESTSQINLSIVKEGSKKISEVFPDQAKGKEKENRATKRKKAQEEAKQKPVEEKPTENEQQDQNAEQ